MKILCRGLNSNKNLKKLNLSTNIIGDDGIEMIIEILQKNNKIEKLKLGDNDLTEESLIMISSFLKENKTMKTLDLSENLLMFEEGIDSFCESLLYNNSLTNLNISGCNLDEEKFFKLFNSLKLNKNLKKLNISDNNLTDENLSFLYQILILNKNLNSLNIAFNEYSSSGVSHISNSLTQNYTLESLCISLDEKGILVLLDALKSNKNLRHFKICYENEQIHRHFSKIVEYNSSLTSLDLSKNNIDDDSFKLVCESLKTNKNISILDLSENLISEEAANCLFDVLKENKTLRKINLIFNYISPRFVGNLNLHLENNFLWDPSIHSSMDKFFQKSIFSFLLILKSFGKSTNAFKIPKFVVFEIIKKIDRNSFQEDKIN